MLLSKPLDKALNVVVCTLRGDKPEALSFMTCVIRCCFLLASWLMVLNIVPILPTSAPLDR